MPEAEAIDRAARIEQLIRTGRVELALTEATDLGGAATEAIEVLRLRALAECLLGQYDAALQTIMHAQTLPGGETSRLETLKEFVRDQRRARERAPIYKAFLDDSYHAKRWHTKRPNNFEIYLRRGLLSAELAALATSARQMQFCALGPTKAVGLADQLTAMAETVMAAALSQEPPLLILGDSHSRYFEWLVYEGRIPQHAAGVCSVSEANLYGLYMPSRDVPTRRRMHEALAKFPRHSVVVLHLGEVDCRAIYWNLRRHLGDFGRSFFDTITGNLERLLDEIAATHSRIVVTAPVRPTYPARPEDQDVSGELILKLTNGLCSRMETICQARGLGFASINRDLEEFGAGLGNPYFRLVWGRQEVSHHLSASKVAGLWTRALLPHLR